MSISQGLLEIKPELAFAFLSIQRSPLPNLGSNGLGPTQPVGRFAPKFFHPSQKSIQP